jgi:hypothetical protein
MFFNFFLKKKELKFDVYNTKGQLYKVFLKKNKNSLLMPELNYYFYSDFIKNLKFFSRNVIYKNYIFSQKTALVLLPSYMFKSQFFSNKSLFDDLLLTSKLKGFYLYKNYFKNYDYKYNNIFYRKHLIGYNFYIIKGDFNKYLNFFKITDEKDYNSIGKVKFFLESVPINNNILNNNLNLFFIFN